MPRGVKAPPTPATSGPWPRPPLPPCRDGPEVPPRGPRGPATGCLSGNYFCSLTEPGFHEQPARRQVELPPESQETLPPASWAALEAPGPGAWAHRTAHVLCALVRFQNSRCCSHRRPGFCVRLHGELSVAADLTISGLAEDSWPLAFSQEVVEKPAWAGHFGA